MNIRNFKEGDILAANLGATMVIYNFFKVVSVSKSGKTGKMQRLKAKSVPREVSRRPHEDFQTQILPLDKAESEDVIRVNSRYYEPEGGWIFSYSVGYRRMEVLSLYEPTRKYINDFLD